MPEYASTTYSWSSGQTGASIQTSLSGWHKLKAENSCATRMDSVYIHIIPKVEALIPNDTVVCDGNFALLDAKNEGSSYRWSTGETTRQISVDKPGSYYVEISNACSMVTDTTHLIFIPEDKGVLTTNVFTPNGDGANEVFINYALAAPHYRMQIVNRWGKIVFETNDPFHYWDGTWNGQTMEAGIYFYLIYSQDCRGAPLMVRGSVSLLR
jgi:gliding motility-associated-like protein